MRLATLLVAVLLALPPTASAQFRTGTRLRLVEYSHPAYARRGVLTELIYTGRGNPPYGYPYAGSFRVGRICRGRSVQIWGGRVVAWVAGYADGPFPENPYAYALAYLPYGGSDGSRGRDVGCHNEAGSRTGSISIYARYSDYWYLESGVGYHVVDVLWCSDQLGCQWYAGYARNASQSFMTAP